MPGADPAQGERPLGQAAEGAGDQRNRRRTPNPSRSADAAPIQTINRPWPGVRVRLFKAEGRISPIVEAAEHRHRREGRFEFADLAPPR